MDHLNALLLGLSNERARLNEAKSENERVIRGVWVSQIEREIEREEKFLAPCLSGMTHTGTRC